jgi:hypothetical protein
MERGSNTVYIFLFITHHFLCGFSFVTTGLLIVSTSNTSSSLAKKMASSATDNSAFSPHTNPRPQYPSSLKIITDTFWTYFRVVALGLCLVRLAAGPYEKLRLYLDWTDRSFYALTSKTKAMELGAAGFIENTPIYQLLSFKICFITNYNNSCYGSKWLILLVLWKLPGV